LLWLRCQGLFLKRKSPIDLSLKMPCLWSLLFIISIITQWGFWVRCTALCLFCPAFKFRKKLLHRLSGSFSIRIYLWHRVLDTRFNHSAHCNSRPFIFAVFITMFAMFVVICTIIICAGFTVTTLFLNFILAFYLCLNIIYRGQSIYIAI